MIDVEKNRKLGQKSVNLTQFLETCVKDLFRRAAQHDLIDCETVERWLIYRDNRNDTVHDYGEEFAEATLKLLPTFIPDAKGLADMIETSFND